MDLRTLKQVCQLGTCCREHHPVPLVVPPYSYTLIFYLYRETQELHKGDLSWEESQVGSWKVGWKMMHISLVYISKRCTLLCPILPSAHFAVIFTLLVLRLSPCRQLVGFSKEETSLFLSDCLIIYITNEPFCFRDVKQASINEQFLKLKLLRQSSSFHHGVSPENPLYSIEMQLV